MDWYAVEEIDEAWENTKETVWPFELGKYLKLMLIVFFAGSTVSFPAMPWFNANMMGVSPDFSIAVPAFFLFIVGAALLIGSFFLVISSIFQFMLFQVVIDREVKIGRNFSLHLGRGLRYAGFLLGIGLLTILSIVGLIWSFLVNPVIGVMFMFGGFILAIPFAVFVTLTQNFVIPEMIKSEVGVIQGWKNIYSDLMSQKLEVLVYLVVRWFIQVGVAMLTGAWALAVGIVLLVPFGILGALLALIWTPLVVIPILGGIIAWIIALVGLQAIVQTYLYSYALKVFEDLRK